MRTGLRFTVFLGMVKLQLVNPSSVASLIAFLDKRAMISCLIAVVCQREVLHFHLRPQPSIMRLSLNLYIRTFNYESLPESMYLNVQLEVGGAMSPILIIKIHSKCRFGPTLPSSYSFLPSRSKYFSFFLTRKFFESKIHIHTHTHIHTHLHTYILDGDPK